MQAYAHILQAIADGEQIEVLEYHFAGLTLYSKWFKKPTPEVLQDIAHQKSPDQFRVASNKKTISINGYEFPEPERVVLEIGTVYYTPNLFNERMYDCWTWCRDDSDNWKFNLKRGLIHLTKEAAIAHTKACLSLTNSKWCKDSSQVEVSKTSTSNTDDTDKIKDFRDCFEFFKLIAAEYPVRKYGFTKPRWSRATD